MSRPGGRCATCRTWNRSRWVSPRGPAPSAAAPTGRPSWGPRDSRRVRTLRTTASDRLPMLCPWRSPHASMKSRYSTSAHRTRIPEPVGTTSPLASSSNSPDSGSTEYASARNRSCSSGYPAAYERSPSSPTLENAPPSQHPALEPDPDPAVRLQTEHVVPGPRSGRRSGQRPRPRSLLHRAAADDDAQRDRDRDVEERQQPERERKIAVPEPAGQDVRPPPPDGERRDRGLEHGGDSDEPQDPVD